MAKTYLMYWVKSQKRWLKEYQGKSYSISVRQLRKLGYAIESDTNKDHSAYAANDWWEKKQAAIDAQPIEHETAFLQQADQQLAAGQAWVNRINRAMSVAPLDASTSLKNQVEAFRQKSIKHARSGIIKPSRLEKINNSLGWFNKFCDLTGTADMSEVNAGLVDSYYAWLFKTWKIDKDLSPYTTRDHFQVFRTMVISWAENGLCPLPMNIYAKRFTFPLPKPKYNYWTKASFQTVYKAAQDRLRLYMLLCANCGMYASDIGTMKQGAVDFKAKTLTYQRKKTGEDIDRDQFELSSNVPEVTYPLWPETLKLLKEHRSDHAELFLVNEDGGQLWKDGIDENGDPWKVDNIASMYYRFCRVLKAKKTITSHNTLENLRKTSAQFLSDSDHKACVDQFGQWSQASVRTKHYTEVTDKQFSDALAWLRTKYLDEEQSPVRRRSDRK